MSLTEKVDKYKNKHDLYESLMAFIDSHKSGQDHAIIINSNDPKMLDPANPTVTIARYQENRIINITDHNMFIRELVDFLFEPEAYRGKNYTDLKQNFPEKIAALKAYTKSKFPNLKDGEISKAISNKCRGK